MIVDKMIWKATAFLSLIACVLGDGHHAISEQQVVLNYKPGPLGHIGEHEPEHHDTYAWSYPSYEFSYKVEDPHTHDFKGQHEHRDGDVVTGMYWLLQPDGYKRTVKYSADKHSGFHADVHYEKAHHDEPLGPSAEETIERETRQVETESKPNIVEVSPVIIEQSHKEDFLRLGRRHDQLRREERRREEVLRKEHHDEEIHREERRREERRREERQREERRRDERVREELSRGEHRIEEPRREERRREELRRQHGSSMRSFIENYRSDAHDDIPRNIEKHRPQHREQHRPLFEHWPRHEDREGRREERREERREHERHEHDRSELEQNRRWENERRREMAGKLQVLEKSHHEDEYHHHDIPSLVSYGPHINKHYPQHRIYRQESKQVEKVEDIKK